MSVRNELETLLSISQGTAEDYQEYLLRMLEEANNAFDVSEASEAKGEDIYSKLTQKTKDWFNKGIEAYNGNQPIPEFPKTVIQAKVKPIIVPEQSLHEESIFEQESVMTIPDELQDAVNAQFESIPDVVSSPEIEDGIQENISNIEESIPDIVSLEAKINYQFTLDSILEKTSIDAVESELTNVEFSIPEKKKRGRKPGTKNKPKIHVEDPPIFLTLEPETTTTIRILPPEGEVRGGDEVVSDGNYASTPIALLHEPSEKEVIVPEGAITEQDTDATYASIFKTTMDERIASAKSVCGISEENLDSSKKTQKPLDIFRILVCQNYEKPFGEIFKLAENNSIDIKKSTALVACSNMKATITTLKNLGMLKED